MDRSALPQSPLTAHSLALGPVTPRALEPRPARLPALAARALPAVARSATAVAVGLAAEYAIRALSNRALNAVVGSLRGRDVAPALPSIPSVPSISSMPAVTRIVITELVVVERTRRRG